MTAQYCFYSILRCKKCLFCRSYLVAVSVCHVTSVVLYRYFTRWQFNLEVQVIDYGTVFVMKVLPSEDCRTSSCILPYLPSMETLKFLWCTLDIHLTDEIGRELLGKFYVKCSSSGAGCDRCWLLLQTAFCR